MNAKRVVLGAVFCILLTGLSGCTAPLALQELSGVAPVSFNPTGMGKGDSAWLVRYDDVVQATLRAGEMLRLNLEKKEIGEDQTVFRYIDSRGKKIDIKIGGYRQGYRTDLAQQRHVKSHVRQRHHRRTGDGATGTQVSLSRR